MLQRFLSKCPECGDRFCLVWTVSECGTNNGSNLFMTGTCTIHALMLSLLFVTRVLTARTASARSIASTAKRQPRIT